MTDEELTALTQEISAEKFQKLFKHRASFNQRLRTTGGRYVLSTGNIEVNPRSMNDYGRQEVIDIVKHELCHYHLHLEGKGYKHQDGEFQELLRRVKGTMHCRSLEQYRLKQKKRYQYTCKSCHISFKRTRQLDTRKYVCAACKGTLKKI
ncbi:SprT family protein [Marinococcus sp. PL1-022]|uniref:SprT family protein n=1 Tax=Marinococcus sp. PL1-022 TaxID=3095363 RepID=UPI0029C24AF1|nr:SprT family protein [Marinococcus sp. PL1-022]MDX6153732.1 SprT family protein [Marinococcus sp. PL1-022]